MEDAAPYLPEDLNALDLPALPIALRPDYSTRRIIAQKGAFTLHGSGRRPLEQLAEEDTCDLVQFTMAPETAGGIRLALLIAGLEETTVFPDMEGLARELNYRWTIEDT